MRGAPSRPTAELAQCALAAGHPSPLPSVRSAPPRFPGRRPALRGASGGRGVRAPGQGDLKGYLAGPPRVLAYLPVEDPEPAQLLQPDRAGGLGAVGQAGVVGGIIHVPGLHHGDRRATLSFSASRVGAGGSCGGAGRGRRGRRGLSLPRGGERAAGWPKGAALEVNRDWRRRAHLPAATVPRPACADVEQLIVDREDWEDRNKWFC